MSRLNVVNVVVVLAAMTASPVASAEELLLHDALFTLDESGANAHGFYWFDTPASAPSDWTSPNDYFNGDVYVRYEVINQATTRPSQFQFCIWQSGDRETCSSYLSLDGPGSVATANSSPSTWWTNNDVPLDFTDPASFTHLGTPLRNEDDCIISDWDAGYCWSDRTDYLPMTVRLTAVLVSAGSTFSGWSTYIDEEPPPVPEGSFPFTHHYISTSLWDGPGDEGRLGAHALADFDNDGDLDFAVGDGFWHSHAMWWFEYQAPDRWVQHDLGPLPEDYTSGVAFDVDEDGWMDVVTSNAWYRNPGTPRSAPFERFLYDSETQGHDVVIVDIDGDGEEEIVQMFEDVLFHWYDRPSDPTTMWIKNSILDDIEYEDGQEEIQGIHGAFGPAGIGDLDGDGDNDIFRSNIWLENADGDARRWRIHDIPFGDQEGPWGLGARSVIVDIDDDGDNDVVATECDMINTHAAILYNTNGDGSEWRREDLDFISPGEHNSLHSLQVADFDQDGDLDIFTVEQEDMRGVEGGDSLPLPRWFIYENTGDAFVEHVIFDENIGGHEAKTGDVDLDGDLDIVSKVWLGYDGNANGGEEHVDFMENRMIDRLDNGVDLDGWQTPTGGEFSVSDGAIECTQASGSQGGLLLSERQYDDFGLEFEVWPDWGVDTGVYLRTTTPDLSAYQICIDYQTDNPMGGIYGEGFGTWEYWLGTWDFTILSETEIQGDPALFELADWAEIWNAGAWNSFRARVEGNPPHIEVWINGTKVTDHTETELWHDHLGYIGLQVHDGEGEWPEGALARFRNIYVYDLSFFDRIVMGGPSVRITSPAPGESFTAGDDVTITAEATGGEGTVTSVTFSQGSTVLAEDTEPPYSTVWENVPTGSHLLFATVTNSLGETAEASVTISVTQGPGDVIHLEAEEYDEMSGITNSGTFIEGCDDGDWIMFSDVDLALGYNTLVALVGRSGSDDSVAAEVHLDALDGELIATITPQDTGDWYTFEEQTTTIDGGTGTHDLYVVFTGGWGVGNFDWFELRDPNNVAPTVTVTSPTDGETFELGQAITIAAEATDPDSEVATVDFYADDEYIGRATETPYQLEWTDAALGDHTLTAIATDQYGAQGTSEPVAISVVEDDGGDDGDGGDDDDGCSCRASGSQRSFIATLAGLLDL